MRMRLTAGMDCLLNEKDFLCLMNNITFTDILALCYKNSFKILKLDWFQIYEFHSFIPVMKLHFHIFHFHGHHHGSHGHFVH